LLVFCYYILSTGAVVGTITLNPMILASVGGPVFYYRQLQPIKTFQKNTNLVDMLSNLTKYYLII